MAKKSTAKKLVVQNDIESSVIDVAEEKQAVKESIKEDIEDTIRESKIKINLDENMSSTEVYDEGDLASAIEMNFIAQALQRHKEKLAPEKHKDFDGEHCIGCWEDIPQVRLDMGRIRCFDCQTLLEKTNKLYGRH